LTESESEEEEGKEDVGEIEEESGAERVIGMIAQEVRKVLPEVVHENPATGLLSVAYTEIFPVLLDAFNEFVAKCQSEEEKTQWQLSVIRGEVAKLAKEVEQQSTSFMMAFLTVQWMTESLSKEQSSPRLWSTDSSLQITLQWWVLLPKLFLSHLLCRPKKYQKINFFSSAKSTLWIFKTPNSGASWKLSTRCTKSSSLELCFCFSPLVVLLYQQLEYFGEQSKPCTSSRCRKLQSPVRLTKVLQAHCAIIWKGVERFLWWLCQEKKEMDLTGIFCLYIVHQTLHLVSYLTCHSEDQQRGAPDPNRGRIFHVSDYGLLPT
jgi:hypothetical protein